MLTVLDLKPRIDRMRFKKLSDAEIVQHVVSVKSTSKVLPNKKHVRRLIDEVKVFVEGQLMTLL